MRYVQGLATRPAPVAANVLAGDGTKVTAALCQLDPAAHRMLLYRDGRQTVEPDWPPFRRLAQPVDIANPTAAVQQMLLHFADGLYAGRAPEVFDP